MGETSDKTNKPAKRGLGSIDLAMRLLDILGETDAPMKLKDIAAAAEMPAAKAHRYMASFLDSGMVTQAGRSGRYDLGPLAMRIGVAALARNNVIQRASKNLAYLRNEIHETCFISSWSDRGPIIVYWEDSLRPVTVIVQVGSNMPLMTSATGRAYLGFMERAVVAPVLARELAETGETGATAEALADQARAAGVGCVDGTFQKGISGLSAPLFDAFGNMTGAVTAMGSRTEFESAIDGSVARSLQEFSRSL